MANNTELPVNVMEQKNVFVSLSLARVSCQWLLKEGHIFKSCDISLENMVT